MTAGPAAPTAPARPLVRRAASRRREGVIWSWLEGPQEERRQLLPPSIDERRERRIVEAEQRRQHRFRGKRKDAERDEVDRELFGLDRAHAAGTDALADLFAEARPHQCPDFRRCFADD